MSDPVFSLWDIISTLGYPLVAWLAFKGGQHHGIQVTMEALRQAGVITDDEEEDEEDQ